jgi:putative oxidoreductase
MKDLGLLLQRVVIGGLLAGHGSQKLFGWFSGPGPEGTAGFLESIGIKPSDKWAFAAGASEFLGGSLTALGFLWPLGPITAMAPMGMAAGTVHWGKPIWATKGGAELPVTNLAVVTSLVLTGPGRLSLDRLLSVRVPWQLTALTGLGVAGGVAFGLYTSRKRETETTIEAGKPDQMAASEQEGSA